MNFKTDYTLENFIIGASWEALPHKVQTRLRGCLLDLIGALVIGSRSRQFEAGLRLASQVFGKGDVAVVGAADRLSFIGASAAMGHSSNAYDIDDGHNIIRAHPGTAFIGGVLAAAYEKNISLNDLLAALLVSYETTIRMGRAIMDYYNFAHSSGTFGAVGVVAGVGRIYGFDKERLNNALSIAEFNAPLVPGIRSVEYPSMNKDGVPFGVMTGALAVAGAMCGFEGNKNLLESDEYRHLLDDLGEKYEVMNLYFKPYACCRWAHPAIDACLTLMREHGLAHRDIESVTIKTFQKATMLSKIVPNTSEEAQYNIAYPVAAAIVYGDFGFEQAREESLGAPEVLDIMKRLSFAADDRFDRQFPEKRICQAEIITKDGRRLVSEECQPRGEAHENIGIEWLTEKFNRICSPVLSAAGRAGVVKMVCGGENLPVRTIVDALNQTEHWLPNYHFRRISPLI